MKIRLDSLTFSSRMPSLSATGRERAESTTMLMFWQRCLLSLTGLAILSHSQQDPVQKCIRKEIPTKNPWRDDTQIWNIAHRGGVFEHPEHTLFAFRQAIDNGADVLEVDAQQCATGELVLMHDPTVDRTTNGRGRILNYTLDELRALDAAYTWDAYRGIATMEREPPAGYQASDFRVPTMMEALQAFPHTPFSIDIKNFDFEGQGVENAQALAELLLGLGRLDDVLVASFDATTLATFQQLAPTVATTPSEPEVTSWVLGFLTGSVGTLETHVGLQIPYKVAGFGFANDTLPTNEMVGALRDLDKVVIVYLDPQYETTYDYQLLQDIGVQGIITDYPKKLKMFLN